MKEIYEEAKVAVIKLDFEDVITTSTCPEFNNCDTYDICADMLDEWD